MNSGKGLGRTTYQRYQKYMLEVHGSPQFWGGVGNRSTIPRVQRSSQANLVTPTEQANIRPRSAGKANARPASRPAPRLREASYDDFAQIALLQAEHGLGGWTAEEWRHLWAANPVYVELRGEWPIGWVLETGGDIVGYLGNIPTVYRLGDRRLIAGCAHSWVVASAYRSHSILLLDQYLRQKHADLCIANTVKRESCGSLTAFGVSRVPRGSWDESCVWITEYTSFVASWLSRKKYPMPRILSRPVSAALFLRDVVIKHRIRMKSMGYRNLEIKPCDNFDERFDCFWETLRAENPNKLLAVRTRPILEWHFSQALRENRLWIATAVDGSRLCAYAIFLVQRPAADAVRRVKLVDFQAISGKAELFYPILTWALDRCRLDGLHLLESIGLCVPGMKDVGGLAPYHIKQDAWTYWYKACDRTLAGALSDPDVWAPSLFDGDASVGRS